MQTIRDLAPAHGVRPLCHALGVAAATYYRHREPPRTVPSQSCMQPVPTPAPAPGRRSSPRALSAAERQCVLDVLHEPRFMDLAPAEVYATLLDEGIYLCAERTMYRVLAAEGEVRERRAQRRHPVYQAPELLATQPNELWSWDISVPQQAA